MEQAHRLFIPIVVLPRTVRQFFSLFVSVSQELELLSVRESVELLSAVAQLDTSEVSSCMVEIVRECCSLRA